MPRGEIGSVERGATTPHLRINHRLKVVPEGPANSAAIRSVWPIAWVGAEK